MKNAWKRLTILLFLDKINTMKRILIIDDDATMRELLKEMLEPMGYSLEEASNGMEGLELHTKKPYDLIITDIIMPEMEGLETIMALKRQSPDCKIIAISGGGHADANEYLDAAAKFGAARIFSKPFEKKNLLDAVKHLLPPAARGAV